MDSVLNCVLAASNWAFIEFKVFTVSGKEETVEPALVNKLPISSILKEPNWLVSDSIRAFIWVIPSLICLAPSTISPWLFLAVLIPSWNLA